MAEVCYPSETALPLDHIVLRLEQLSAGEWPTQQKPLDDYRCVADAMVKVHSDQATLCCVALLDAPCKSVAQQET